VHVRGKGNVKHLARASRVRLAIASEDCIPLQQPRREERSQHNLLKGVLCTGQKESCSIGQRMPVSHNIIGALPPLSPMTSGPRAWQLQLNKPRRHCEHPGGPVAPRQSQGPLHVSWGRTRPHRAPANAAAAAAVAVVGHSLTSGTSWRARVRGSAIIPQPPSASASFPQAGPVYRLGCTATPVH
jgi:hypothetical protein